MRVLVVEDEKQLARFLKQGLEQENYVVEVVYDGGQALAAAQAKSFDLILLDWLLPDRDGLSVCCQLRDRGNHTPIIMLTAKDALADKVMGLDSGADDYLTKPFEFDELFARMRSVLRRGAAGASPQLRVADLVLDPSAHTVTRAGQPIPLTAKEFALLEYFMRHSGRVLTRAALLQAVWGYDHDPSSNVVDVYVRYLRRKIDQGFARPLLHTVINVGYKLEG